MGREGMADGARTLPSGGRTHMLAGACLKLLPAWQEPGSTGSTLHHQSVPPPPRAAACTASPVQGALQAGPQDWAQVRFRPLVTCTHFCKMIAQIHYSLPRPSYSSTLTPQPQAPPQAGSPSSVGPDHCLSAPTDSGHWYPDAY